MPRSNLRSAFALGLGSSIAAQQVFTNRITEVAAFEASLINLRGQIERAPITPVTDRQVPRTNVLVYFGVGGIGKTTLSAELRRRFSMHQDEFPCAAVHIDLAEPGATDLEAYILHLRARLGHLASHWNAFDLAFSAYWERAHPGEPLREFVTKNSALKRTAAAIGISDQISSTLTDLITDGFPGIVGVAHKVASIVYTQARQAIAQHRTLSKCELLPDLIEADASLDTLAYFPYLLAWDLSQESAPMPQAAVFVDTFESIAAHTNREFERWLQRSIFLMPNVLFVITGRNRLDWADLDSTEELDYVGIERWPYLHAAHSEADPRQHLVGYLSLNDARSYLETALTDDSRPAIPEQIRSKIAKASGGLPLYLDLAVNEFLDQVARGRTPQAGDFGQPLGSVVSRLLRDLEKDERRLLRAAALVSAFDLDLLRAGCPEVPDAVQRRFRDRPFLELDTDRVLPYALHRTLRETIRQADVDLRDSWSERERKAVASRMAEHLRGVSSAASADGDRGAEIAVFQLAMELTAITGSFFAWTVPAAQRLLTAGSWDIPFFESDVPGDVVRGMAVGLRGARERRAGNVDNSLRLMNAALSYSKLPVELVEFLMLHRAHALRVSGRYAEAAVDYTALAGATGELSIEALYWLTDYQFLDGRFSDALRALEQISELGNLESGHLGGEVLRLRGHVFRVNGMFSDAVRSYSHARALAVATGNIAAEGKALTDLAQTLSWEKPEDALKIATRALEVNEGIRNQVEVVKLCAATAVAWRRTGQREAANSEITHGLALAESCGYPGGKIWCLAARALIAVLDGDQKGYSRIHREIVDLTTGLGGNRFWADIVSFWSNDGSSTPQHGVSPQWLAGLEATRRRWYDAVRRPPTEGAGTQ
ncbi:MAG TPA: hypothetical protein VHV74_26700 [Pseudonocardiaceae bacterium]|nr:hypothetical protein [Pseudonocardiaceae bacterium]